MKKVILLAICFASVVALSAKPKVTGSMDALIGAERVGLVLDFDKALYNGTAFQTFLNEQHLSAGDWKDIQYCDLYAAFVAGANKEFGKRIIGIQDFIKAPIYISIEPMEMTSTGSMKCGVYLHNADGSILGSTIMDSKGGKQGAWSTLLGEGFNDLGERFAKSMMKMQDDK